MSARNSPCPPPAARRLLLVDHGKFGRVAVDAGIDEAGLRQLREAEVPFEVVPLA